MNLSKFIVAGCLTVICSGCGSSGGGSGKMDLSDISGAKSGDLVVSVNGVEIHEGFLDTISRINPSLGQQIKNPLTRKKFISSIVDQQVLYQEALKHNLDNSEKVLARTIISRYNTVANQLVEDKLEEAMKKAYDEKKDTQFTKVAFSQIVIKYQADESKDEPKSKDDKSTKKDKDSKADAKSKDDKDAKTDNSEPTAAEKSKALAKAQDIKKKLDKGEDFETLAKQFSDDKLTKGKGGKAGQASRDDKRFQRAGLKKVVDAIFALKKDGVSDPIETDKAVYIVKVNSDPIIVEFEQAKRDLQMVMQNNVRTALLADLKKSATIKWGAKYDTKEDKPAGGENEEEINITPKIDPSPDAKGEDKSSSPPPAEDTTKDPH